MSAWILVIISIERSVAIAVPMKHKRICTRKNVGIVLGVVVFAVLVYNSHYAYGFCPMPKPYEVFYDTHAEMLDLVLNVVIPFSVCSLANIIIIVCIRRSMSKRSEMASGNAAGEKGGKRKVESVTIMLIATNVMFIVTTLPFSIYLNQVEVWQLEMDVAFSLLSYANNGINFWIYCISGQKFRRELIAVLGRCCNCCRNKDNSSKSSTISTQNTLSS
ncbi:FMRFamide peptide receptor frpr-18-like [Tubulanus polymorphus]|uniref:FMRFamide peptide receptor frpr-18-like n=1 Tax=Tubulanus polymorphus TaxID=672921 RepID=UPI003DA2EB20